jgi:hypothetical protein
MTKNPPSPLQIPRTPLLTSHDQAILRRGEKRPEPMIRPRPAGRNTPEGWRRFWEMPEARGLGAG